MKKNRSLEIHLNLFGHSQRKFAKLKTVEIETWPKTVSIEIENKLNWILCFASISFRSVARSIAVAIGFRDSVTVRLERVRVRVSKKIKNRKT